MLNVLVCVSGGGTNLQALIDAVRDGRIRNARIAGVISNNRSAYALERARQNGIDAVCPFSEGLSGPGPPSTGLFWKR